MDLAVVGVDVDADADAGVGVAVVRRPSVTPGLSKQENLVRYIMIRQPEQRLLFFLNGCAQFWVRLGIRDCGPPQPSVRLPPPSQP